jgi:DNA-3-methyladenine glycosylase I
MSLPDYKFIMESMKHGLLRMRMPDVTQAEFDERLNRFMSLDYRKLSDDEICWMMAYVRLFNMGRKASMIEAKLPEFKRHLYGLERITCLNDEEQAEIAAKTGFAPQVGQIIANAKTYASWISECGSFSLWLKMRFGIVDTDAEPKKLKAFYSELQKLQGYGETAPWHLITELGFFAIKPDSVICRIFYRLGLVQHPEDMSAVLEEGRKIATTLGLPPRYIDIVAVKFGQVGESSLLGTRDGICTDQNPKCNICELTRICRYFNDKWANVLKDNSQTSAVADSVSSDRNAHPQFPALVSDIIAELSAVDLTQDDDYRIRRRGDGAYIFENVCQSTDRKNIITLWPRKRDNGGAVRIFGIGKYAERKLLDREDLGTAQFRTDLREAWRRTQ